MLPELATEARAQTGVGREIVTVTTFRLYFEHRSARVAARGREPARERLHRGAHARPSAVSGDTAEFIEERAAAPIGRDRARREARSRDVKTQNAGTLPEDFEANQRQFERARPRRCATRSASCRSQQSDEAFYKQQALVGGGAEDFCGGQVLTPRRRVEMLELQLAEYRSRGFTDKHPDVIAARWTRSRSSRRRSRPAANDPRTSRRGSRTRASRRSARRCAARRPSRRSTGRAHSCRWSRSASPRRRGWRSSSTRSSASTSISFDALSGVQQEATRGRRRGEHGAAPEGRAVPHSRAGAAAAGAELAQSPAARSRSGVMLGSALAAASASAPRRSTPRSTTPRRLQADVRSAGARGDPRGGAAGATSPRGARARSRLALAFAGATVGRRASSVSAAGYWWQSRSQRRRRESGSRGGAGGLSMYHAHYGLLRSPFEMTPDPAFLCTERRRISEGLATLVYGVKARKGFVLLTGEVGTGKTTLLHALLAQLDREHAGGVHLQSAPRSARLLPRAVRRVRHRDALRDQGRVPDRAEPLPDRAPRAGPAHAADRRRGAEPLGRDARGGAAALESRDAQLEAAADHAGRAARARRDARAAGAAPAPPAHRDAPPAAPVHARRDGDLRARAAAHRRLHGHAGCSTSARCAACTR